MQKSYIEGPYGQIHYRKWPGNSSSTPPLMCLAPSPYSSVSYKTLAPLLAIRNDVIAPDYPGYGGSTPCPKDATITDYANAVQTVAKNASPEQPVDILGFHTGCLVAVEMALKYPERVNRLVLIDIPYFDPDTRARLLTKMATPTPIESDIQMLAKAWDFSLVSRLQHLPLKRGYELFLDQISSGEGMNMAFRAAFTYECDQSFRAVTVPTFVIATQAGLLEQTRSAAKVLNNAELIELTEVKVAVLEQAAKKVADTVNTLLDNRS